jgi:hypothetical protein
MGITGVNFKNYFKKKKIINIIENKKYIKNLLPQFP